MGFIKYEHRLAAGFRKEFPVMHEADIQRMVKTAMEHERDDFFTVPLGTLASLAGSTYIRTDYTDSDEDAECWAQVTGIQYWSGIDGKSAVEMKDEGAEIIGHVEVK